MKRIIIAVLLVAIVGGFGTWYVSANRAPTVSFRTAKVERGDLRASITSTGTIEPLQVIDVGAQVSGPIIRFGDDPRKIEIGKDEHGKPLFKPIDYGSPLHKDTVLAEVESVRVPVASEQRPGPAGLQQSCSGLGESAG